MSKKILNLGLVAHACSPVTWNSETGGQPELYSLKTPPQKNLNNFFKFLIMKMFII